MKKAMLIVTIIFAVASAMAQSRLLGRRSENRSQLLEPLLPFAEAVEKAKAGNPQGYYALAIHYAKGEAIERNAETARQFLRRASDLNYSNAVFVATMLLEENYRPNDLDVHGYTGVSHGSCRFLPLTNQTDIVTIRAGYERAISLGVSVATNELARFERRVKAAQVKAREKAKADREKARNAELAKLISVKSEMDKKKENRASLRRRLNDPDADDDEGRIFTWTVGGKEGVTLDVLIRAKEESGWHYLEKATITIDKDGRIIKIEGRPGRTEIQS